MKKVQGFEVANFRVILGLIFSGGFWHVSKVKEERKSVELAGPAPLILNWKGQ